MGAWNVVKQWAGRFWDDLKNSTDASLLGIARFFGLLYGPIDSSLPIDQAWRKALKFRLPSHASWRHAAGGITYLLFLLLIVTGVLLSFYYRPSAAEAYQSIQYIVSGVTFGWLIRDLHVWGANLIVLTALVHMARVFFDAAYKPPRETNWLAGLLLLFIVFAFGATGYLLPWDQWAYWAVTDGLAVLARVPVVGGAAVEVLRGDPVVSGATLSRFFAWHVIILPWVAVSLLMLHFALVRKHGIAPPVAHRNGGAGVGTPFFPHHVVRSFMVAVGALTVTITAAILFPRPVGDPATPAQVPGMLVSTWIVADVARALTYYLGSLGLTVFVLVGFALALLPLFDRDPERQLRRRPIVATLGAVFFMGFLLAWLAGRQLRSMPPQTAPVAIPAPSTAESPAPPASKPVPPNRPAAAPDSGIQKRKAP